MASSSACLFSSGPAAPRRPTGFGLEAGASRVFDLRDHLETGAGNPYAVEVPGHTHVVVLHLYCRHSGGSFEVRLSSAGAGGMACTKRGSSGHVYLGPDDTPVVTTAVRAHVDVQAPRGAVWSVAVDSLPRDPGSIG